MKTSPLQFAKDFERLKSRLAEQPAGDLRLLLLAEFWPSLEDYISITVYDSYFDEYIPYLSDHIKESNLLDLRPDELRPLSDIVTKLSGSSIGPAHHVQLKDKLVLVRLELARKLFFAGAVCEGLEVLRVAHPDIDPAWADDLDEESSEIDAFRAVCDKAVHLQGVLSPPLATILRHWQIEHEAISHEEINCLFVERNDHGVAERGRMRVLKASSEPRRKITTNDEVTFDSQLKAPDDPIVGVTYDSLKAVRRVLHSERLGSQADRRIRARFEVVGSDHTFTGDSIGLAAGLVTYTQLLKPEVLRQERFIAYEAAFTGGTDESGHLLPVNEESLQLKIERAFFSPIRYLVLPQQNLATARKSLNDLCKPYPRRRLRLTGAETMAEVIENRNIVRAEKVCMGPYMFRKARKYSRTVHIQVPILLALLYLLTCLLFPKAWIGFDWNPEYVRLTKTGFEVLNRDSLSLWTRQVDCDSLSNRTELVIGNLDADLENELAVVPKTIENAPCPSNANLFVYDDDGTLLYRRHCAVHGEYPGGDQPYTPAKIDILATEDATYLLTRAVQDYPARLHLKFWSLSGDLVGWYINAGYGGAAGSRFISQSDIGPIFLGFNNRMKCACLYALPIIGCEGVSPPYVDKLSDPAYDLRGVRPGNQTCYVLFPRTDVNNAIHRPYNSAEKLVVESEGRIRADIIEVDDPVSEINYYLDDQFRVLEAKADDNFVYFRNSLVAGGHLPPVDKTTYLSYIRDAVSYWTDSGWVTEGQLRAIKNTTE